jgi:hypothetical protein
MIGAAGQQELIGAAFEWQHLWPVLALIGALLLGSVVIAAVRRWQLRPDTPYLEASEQLAQYRQLREQGVISEEEFKRLRAVLGGELRRAVDLPVRPPAESFSKANDQVGAPGGPPSDTGSELPREENPGQGSSASGETP